MGNRRVTAVVVAASALAAVPAGAATARPHLTGFSAFDQRLLADINAARGERGVAPLQLSSQLESPAYSWAQHMAETDHVYDNPRFGRTMNAACPGWRHVGEAVGKAGGVATADDLFNVYMHDSTRRQTILSRRYKLVGVSTVATDENGSTVHWNAIELADHCSR